MQNHSLNQKPHYEENVEELWTYDDLSEWVLKALLIITSSYYSTENEELQVSLLNQQWISHKMTFLHEEVLIKKFSDNIKILIKFILCDENDWVKMKSINSSDPSLIKCVVKKHISERLFLFNINLQSIASSECFEVIVTDSTNIILLILKENINIDCELSISALKLTNNTENMGKIIWRESSSMLFLSKIMYKRSILL